jgi:hypothetical protein
MRCAFALLGAAVLGVAAACTTFDFPEPAAPSDAGVDGTVPRDASVDAGDASMEDGPVPATSFLSEQAAAQLCTLVFECPRLDDTIEGSLVIPVGTPATPLNFSGCMDWLAGPVSVDRVHLQLQQQILGEIAAASSCAVAYAASPIQPADAGSSCTPVSTCASPTVMETCSPPDAGGAFTIQCSTSPLFETAGTCGYDAEDGGICVANGCPNKLPLNCSLDDNYLRACDLARGTYVSYTCGLSGRTCSGTAAPVPDCVIPGQPAAPCGLKPADDCAGTSVRFCTGSTIGQTEFDCQAVGRTCSVASGVARCVGPNDQCTPFDSTVNTCSGSSITLCIGGAKSTFDCKSIGKTCLPGDAATTAHCG